MVSDQGLYFQPLRTDQPCQPFPEGHVPTGQAHTYKAEGHLYAMTITHTSKLNVNTYGSSTVMSEDYASHQGSSLRLRTAGIVS